MDNEAILQLYEQFAQIMRANGMDWVVNQVEEQLNQLPNRENSVEDLPLNRYTPQERLFALLRAAEFVIVDTALMESETLNFLSERRRSSPLFIDGYTQVGEAEKYQVNRKIDIDALSTNEFDRNLYEDTIELEQDRLQTDVIAVAASLSRNQQRQQEIEQLQALIARIRNEILNA